MTSSTKSVPTEIPLGKAGIPESIWTTYLKEHQAVLKNANTITPLKPRALARINSSCEPPLHPPIPSSELDCILTTIRKGGVWNVLAVFTGIRTVAATEFEMLLINLKEYPELNVKPAAGTDYQMMFPKHNQAAGENDGMLSDWRGCRHFLAQFLQTSIGRSIQSALGPWFADDRGHIRWKSQESDTATTLESSLHIDYQDDTGEHVMSTANWTNDTLTRPPPRSLVVPPNHIALLFLRQDKAHCIPLGASGGPRGWFLAPMTMRLRDRYATNMVRAVIKELIRSRRTPGARLWIWEKMVELWPKLFYQTAADGKTVISKIPKNSEIVATVGVNQKEQQKATDQNLANKAAQRIQAVCVAFGLRPPVYPSGMKVMIPSSRAGKVFNKLDYQPHRVLQVLEPGEEIARLRSLEGLHPHIINSFEEIVKVIPEKWTASPASYGVQYLHATMFINIE